jgi:peptide/nickel transport system ATP-binding protein
MRMSATEREVPIGRLQGDFPLPTDDVVLTVNDLSVEYVVGKSNLRVVQGVDLELRRGRTRAIVGESGSGKTTVARAIMGLVGPPNGHVSGTVKLGERDLLKTSDRELSRIRGRDIAMIFQEPIRSLNPAFTVGDQIAEVVRTHGGVSRSDAWKQAIDAMRRVHIPSPERLARRYPFEFSGGMCQRVMIAMAVVRRPTVLIADEPTTALDVTVQAQVLDLLKELQDEMGLAMLFITHDLGVVADIADDVSVMYAGEVVEAGTAEQVFFAPQHPYSAGLLASIPNVLDDEGRFRFIRGRVPSAAAWPSGCRFAPRCPHALEACTTAPIALDDHGDRVVRCCRVKDLVLEGVRE